MRSRRCANGGACEKTGGGYTCDCSGTGYFGGLSATCQLPLASALLPQPSPPPTDVVSSAPHPQYSSNSILTAPARTSPESVPRPFAAVPAGSNQVVGCTQTLANAYNCQNGGGCYTDSAARSFCVCSGGFGGGDCSLRVTASCGPANMVVQTPLLCVGNGSSCEISTDVHCVPCPGGAKWCANGGSCTRTPAGYGCDCTGTGYFPGIEATCQQPMAQTAQAQPQPPPAAYAAPPGSFTVPSARPSTPLAARWRSHGTRTGPVN